ncbi:MAG TPA: hypothetical protein VF753_19735 [Terriglobales bacterium]
MLDGKKIDVKEIIGKWFSRGEVKTPLSFFFKVLPWLTGIWGLILYAPVPVDIKVYLLKLAAWIFGGMFVFVGLFAWFKPHHLTYGEASHRAERKIILGSSTRTYTEDELQMIPPTRNPQQLTGGTNPS